MHGLALLSPSESPHITLRRSRLYIATFCALGLAVHLNALTWEGSQRAPSLSYLALALIALLSGALALVVFKRAEAALSASSADETDREALASVISLRATRAGQLPAIALHALLPPSDGETRATPASSTPTKKQDVVKRYDPWAKVLEELPPKPDKEPAKRRQARNRKN